MKTKKLWLSVALLLTCLDGTLLFRSSLPEEALNYPNFCNNPRLSDQQRKLMAPYLLPLDHPAKNEIDAIFSSSRVISDETALKNAGFEIIASMPGSFVTVARHPKVPGFVFKLYLDSEKRTKDNIANWEWLTRRCIGADKIRKVIQKQHLRHFSIPDKWLYVLPSSLIPENGLPILLIATDMQLENEESTTLAWKTQITTDHLDELYTIIKHGYGTIGLVRNVPLTKDGKFAFTDTEYPVRPLKLKRVKPYLSEDMQDYWDQLIH